MSWQVIMTDTAKSDLREITLWIYEQSGEPETAISFVTALRDKCRSLESQPESGAIPKDYVLKSLGYRYLIYKHYLVFYLTAISEKRVYIYAFFNEKLDYFRYMRKRI